LKKVIDRFSAHAGSYASYRPGSPGEVFDFLFQKTASFGSAWDAGTGNGQVALRLADKFTTVYGTDISREQLDKAVTKNNVIYLCERAESTSLADHSVDLVTAAQAVHWFDIGKFNEAVKRVAKPGALVAVWSYSWSHTIREVDAIVAKATKLIESYWDPERRHIEAEYKTVDFPFAEIRTPQFEIRKDLAIDEYFGYLNTWSGLKNYIAAKGHNPIDEIFKETEKVWGKRVLPVRWPVFMRAGFVT
jgi:SAM-dependent methyltransferase